MSTLALLNETLSPYSNPPHTSKNWIATSEMQIPWNVDHCTVLQVLNWPAHSLASWYHTRSSSLVGPDHHLSGNNDTDLKRCKYWRLAHWESIYLHPLFFFSLSLFDQNKIALGGQSGVWLWWQIALSPSRQPGNKQWRKTRKHASGGISKNFSLGTNEKERLYIFVGREGRLCQLEFIPSRSLLMCKSVSASFGK